MADSRAWYLKMEDGTVYGPADLSRLQAWAREGRIEPSSQISSDRKAWAPASLMPELGLEWIVEVEQGQYYGPFHQDVIRDLIAQKRVPASARRFRLDTGRAQEDPSKELNAALEKAKSALAERESALATVKAALAEQKALVAELRNQETGLSEKLEQSLKESKSAATASASRIGELEIALKKALSRAEELGAALEGARLEVAAERTRCKGLSAELEKSQSETEAERARAKELAATLAKSKSETAAEHARVDELAASLAKSQAETAAEHVRVENLLAQLVAAAEREKALRADLDLAHKTASSERKCVEVAIRRERQAERELEGVRKEVEDLRMKLQKAKEQPKATKGKGLFQGASAADLAFLEQAARRELASARGRSASVPRPQPKALDVIDV